MRTRMQMLTALLALAVVGMVEAQQPAFEIESIDPGHEIAVFAGGCFWCMEPPYDRLDGVIATISGYTGGHTESPTYHEVTFGDTGHYEAVLVVFDPRRVTYDELVAIFWFNIDPTDDRGQFCDRGSSYRTAIFYRTPQQEAAATRSRDELEASNRLRRRVVTEILPTATFWIAEDYHQNYYVNSPIRYRTYRSGCGRDARLRQLWGSDAPY